MPDRASLEHFIDAQAAVYAAVLDELRSGRKRLHWMCFVFPQLASLGHSAMARRFAISGLEQATDFLRHPVLGRRLKRCTAIVNENRDRPVDEIFGSPDDRKFHSSMTLFAQVAGPGPSCFAEAVERHFGGVPDQRTIALLGESLRQS